MANHAVSIKKLVEEASLDTWGKMVLVLALALNVEVKRTTTSSLFSSHRSYCYYYCRVGENTAFGGLHHDICTRREERRREQTAAYLSTRCASTWVAQ